ncbi:MAG: hypothetical protein HY706_06940 [Candidatus Hydrogenedentes bacterium]|nr:hypothetical protein [Candidatus Hydrogenedentota bacterium]
MTLIGSGANLLCTLACSLAVATPDGNDALGRADIVLDSLQSGLDTQLILGNGDLLAFIEQQGTDLIIGTSKNDVWDLRLDTSKDAPLVSIKEIERIAKEGKDGQSPQDALNAMVAKHAAKDDSYQGHPYPCPRMTARWRIPLTEPDQAIRKARLDLRTATATIDFAQGGGLKCYIPATSNVVILEPFGEAKIGTPKLEPVLDPGIIPNPEIGDAWIVQKLPDDLDVPGVTFAVVAHGDGSEYVLGQATSRETSDPKDAATRLCEEALRAEASDYWKRHCDWWDKFWDQSSVELADRELESLWYRQVYFIGATIRSGKASPGLFAPITNNAPAWHGDYHTNYNIQQTYWSVFPTNHVELDEPYERLIFEYLPRAKWLARRIYDVDGAFYPHVIMFDEPAEPESCRAPNNRQYLHIVWGYTLGVTAFSVQNLWWRYRYEPNREFLEKKAYPVLSATADFYANLLAEYRGPDGKSRPPTVSPEHWGWTAGLERNRNCTFDTALIAFNLKAATEAASVLGVDAERREKWIHALEMLPSYPRHGTDPALIVDVDGAPPTEYNIPIPSTLVFPGEQLTVFSPELEKDIFIRTIAGLRSNGNNDLVINSMARARLDMPDAVEYLKRESLARLRPNGTLTLNRREPPHEFNAFGHYTEMYGAAAAVSELLMQSATGVIRVFPCWPRAKDAKFDKLRAVGGFLVSGTLSGGQITNVTVEGTVGGECRLLSPWPAIEVDGKPTAIAADGIVRMETVSGARLVFTPGK